MPPSRRGISPHLPRYLEVKAALLERLSSMPSLASFPSERDLCEELDVSRTTIRRALSELQKDGAVRRLAGKGTFVDETKYTDHAMQSFIGFDEDARTQHRSITNKILSQTVVPCSLDAARRLGLHEGDRLFLLERLRFIDGQAMCLVTAMLPLDLCPGLLEQDFGSSSLYNFLRQHEIVTTLAKRSIEVKPASMEEAAHLEISEGAPVFLFESIGFTKGNKPLDYVRSRYPAYKARFESEVKGTAQHDGMTII